MEELLTAREERANHIQQLIQTYPYKTIIVMKANVPGIYKNITKMRFICNFYHKLIHDSFKEHMIDMSRVMNDDGNYIYYVVDEEGPVVKEKTILIEEENILGRLIDIDVYNQKPITRSDVACQMRRCLVCDQYAHICVRSQAHTETEIFHKIDEIIESFLVDFLLVNTVKAIYAELDLYPKFGLVSRENNGAHQDMDYQLFVRSTMAIKPFLKEYIIEGIKGIPSPKKLQDIGQQAEAAMFAETGGINTQKGLIFALGIFLPVTALAIYHNEDHRFMIKKMQEISSVIIGDYYQNITEKTDVTAGDTMYLKYGFKGIRGEALSGFSLVFDSYQTASNEEDQLLDYLMYFMSKIDDTTILNRTNIDTLHRVKKEMSDIIEHGGVTYYKDRVLQLSKQYIQQNISPGGSADLLVLKVLFESVNHLLCGNSVIGICV